MPPGQIAPAASTGGRLLARPKVEPVVSMSGTLESRSTALLVVGCTAAIVGGTLLHLDMGRWGVPLSVTVMFAGVFWEAYRRELLGRRQLLELGGPFTVVLALYLGLGLGGSWAAAGLVGGGIMAGSLLRLALQPGGFAEAVKLWGRGSHREALALFEQVQRTAPTRYESFLNAAVLRLHLGEPLLAERDAREALRLAPWSFRSMTALGVSLTVQGRCADAVAPLQQAVDRARHVAITHLNLGVALARSGDLPAAEAPLRVAARGALRMYGNNLLVHHLLRKLSLGRGDAAGAARELVSMRALTLGLQDFDEWIAAAPGLPGSLALAAELREITAALGSSEVPLEGACCALHPETQAILVCPRCGAFACGRCTVELDGTRACLRCDTRGSSSSSPR